jgi:GntR family transcriptional regulator
MPKLNKDNSPMPLWYQVKESILEKIEQGAYAEEKSLPSEKQLCEEFQVSVITIRKAMDELAKEGLLEKKQGKGTFLNLKKIERELNTFYGFSSDISRSGAKPSRKILGFKIKEPSLNIAKKLCINTDELIYEIRTLTFANDIPVIISKFFIAEKKLLLLKKEYLIKNSIYNILQHDYGIKLKMETWNIEAIMLDEYEAKLLDVPINSSALLHEAISFDFNNKAVMYAKGIIRADKCKLSITLSNEEDRSRSILLSR